MQSAGLPAWQQSICQQIRELAHAADPAVHETIKRTVQPYFVLDGNICALLAAKNQVNVFVYDPIAPDPEGVINQGQGNATARAIQIYRNDPINVGAVLALFRAVIANNRAGGYVLEIDDLRHAPSRRRIYQRNGSGPRGGPDQREGSVTADTPPTFIVDDSRVARHLTSDSRSHKPVDLAHVADPDRAP